MGRSHPHSIGITNCFGRPDAENIRTPMVLEGRTQNSLENRVPFGRGVPFQMPRKGIQEKVRFPQESAAAPKKCLQESVYLFGRARPKLTEAPKRYPGKGIRVLTKILDQQGVRQPHRKLRRTCCGSADFASLSLSLS